MESGRSHFVKKNDLADLLPTLERFPFFVFAIRVLKTSFELTIAARDEKWPERVRRPGAQIGVFPEGKLKIGASARDHRFRGFHETLI